MQKIRLLILSSICFLAMTAFAQDPAKPEARLIESDFIAAMGKELVGDYQGALDLLLRCDDELSDNYVIKYQIAWNYRKLKDYTRATAYAQRALQLAPSDASIAHLMVELYMDKGQLQEASSMLEKMLSSTATIEEDLYILCSDLYIQRNQLKKAVEVLNKMDKVYGINELSVRQKQRIYMKMNAVSDVIAEGQKLIDAFPEQADYKYEQARILLMVGKTDQAAQLLSALLKEHPDDGQALFLMASVLRGQGDETGYTNLIKQSLMTAQVLPEDVMGVLSHSASIPNRQQDAVALAMLVAKAYGTDLEIMLSCADILFANRHLIEAEPLYEKVVGGMPNAIQAWQRLISIELEQKDMAAVRKHAAEMVEIFPNNPSPYLFAATGLIDERKFSDAKEMLLMGRSFVPDDAAELDVQFLGMLADVYTRQGETQLADASYDEALRKQPDNAQILNNYAYALAMRKERLDHAYEISKKLFDRYADNPMYIDTYAWVLYQKGAYQEAEKYMRKAVALTDDATVLEHYGDILYRIGNKNEALIYWRKAKESSGQHSEFLLQKIANKALVE